MKISMPESRSISPEHLHPSTESPTTAKTQDTLVEEHRDIAHGKNLESRSMSAHDSLRTFFQLDTHDSDSDPNISPISDRRSPTRPASALARFFPELSSNLHVVAPSSPDPVDQNMKSLDYASIFESELEDRRESLYKSPTDPEKGENVHRSSLKSGRSRYSGSGDVLDCASSCYSRRTSLTSVNTECAGEGSGHKPADAYSILNSASAGVFDDAASVHSSRAPFVTSHAACRRQPRRADSVRPSRIGTLTPKMSTEELKNKPLPLEPIQEPSPLTIRRKSPTSTEMPPRYPSQYSLLQQRPNQHHPEIIRWQQYGEPCHEYGNQREHQSHREHVSERDEHLYGQGMRRVPTLSQAAEDLEYALADVTQGSNGQQRTVLILDGPLQVSRHNGDLVATRPAPRPPPIAPHSEWHRVVSNDPTRSAKGKSGRSDKSHTAENSNKERRSSNPQPIREISAKGHIAKVTKPKDYSTKKSTKAPKADDDVKGHRQTNSKSSDKKINKLKLKKTFTLSMPSFTRRNSNTGPQDQERDRGVKVLSSWSGASLDPDNRECLSDQASDSSSATSKRDVLLLQLPRLQTQDLETTGLSDDLTRDQEQGQGSSTHPTGLGSAISAGDAAHPALRDPSPENKILVDRMRNTRAFVSTAQASSVHVPPEQIFELDATPPSPSARPEPARKNKHVPINVNFPVDMPESLIVAMMERIESLDDLFNFVLVNKRFYLVFKARELYMIKTTLFKMSPPAWELREMSPPWETEWTLRDPDSRVPEYTPTTYLDRYATDIYTLARLKSMILVRCYPFLRRDTIHGLSGTDPIRLEEVDDAFWRIWTFCRIFGSGKGRENDLEGQMDWLKGGAKAGNYMGAASTMTEPFGMTDILFEPPEGFARGNCGGLSQKQLYDMTEIWTCLAVLLQPMHAKCAEARAVGIFDGVKVAEGDAAREESILEEWTAYVLTLGLSAVLSLSSLCPAEDTAETFKNARSLGLTKWELTGTEVSRSSFLKEAVSRVYEEQERALSTRSDSPRDLTPRELDLANADADRARERRHNAFKIELRARRLRNVQSNVELGTSFSNERPMSEYSAIVRNLDGSIRTSVAVPGDIPPVSPVPTLIFDPSSTSTSSIAPRTPNCTPPPTNNPDPSIFLFPRPHLHPAPAPLSLGPQVQDPVDRAIKRMVHELGFNEDDVKWALKITDTGEGIDMLAAEHLLKQQKRKQQHNPFAPRGKNSLLHSVMKRQGSQDSGWRWA